MARVSIEERGAAGAKKLARMMGWNIYEALGRLYTLWHDSQELEQSECSLGDISTWLDLTGDQEGDIIEALADSGFIRILGEDFFEIVGNSKHIENLRQRRESAKTGGIKSGQVRAIKANASPQIEANGSTETQASDEPCSLQFSAVLCNTEIQKKEEGGEFPKKPEKLAFVIDDEDLNSIFLEKEIKEKHWTAWLRVYPDAGWVSNEIKKASAWECSSPANKKKNFSTFVTRWLGRGWDTRQRTPEKSIAASERRVKCEQCTSGTFRAINRSSGLAEWVSCLCPAGRAKAHFVRFDEQKFERAS